MVSSYILIIHQKRGVQAIAIAIAIAVFGCLKKESKDRQSITPNYKLQLCIYKLNVERNLQMDWKLYAVLDPIAIPSRSGDTG